MASEVGHTNAYINVNHDLSNVSSCHDQGGHERNIFLTGTTSSFGAVHERGCGIIHIDIIHVELNAKSLELIGIAKAKWRMLGPLIKVGSDCFRGMNKYHNLEDISGLVHMFSWMKTKTVNSQLLLKDDKAKSNEVVLNALIEITIVIWMKEEESFIVMDDLVREIDEFI